MHVGRDSPLYSEIYNYSNLITKLEQNIQEIQLYPENMSMLTKSMTLNMQNEHKTLKRNKNNHLLV